MTTAAPQRPTRPTDDAADGEAGSRNVGSQQPRSPSRRLSQQFAYWVRWLHIYLSLLSFTALLFFAVTGLTLNHPTWFGGSSVVSTTAEGELLGGLVPTTGDDDAGIDKLQLVEFLRDKHGIRGALAELRADDRECTVAFKGPGYSADITIDRATSQYELNESRYAAVAILNDLHKGRDTGSTWSLFIDVSAIVMTFVSLSGLVLLFYIKRRLVTGLVTALVGTVLVYLLYAIFVPS